MNMLFITREKDSPVECYNDDGTISMIIDGAENKVMQTGGLDQAKDEDVFTYVNHLQRGHYDDFKVVSKDDATRVFECESEGIKASLASFLNPPNEVEPVEGTGELKDLEVGQTLRLVADLGVYYDVTRIY